MICKHINNSFISKMLINLHRLILHRTTSIMTNHQKSANRYLAVGNDKPTCHVVAEIE